MATGSPGFSPDCRSDAARAPLLSARAGGPAVQAEVQPLIDANLAEVQKRAIAKLIEGNKEAALFKTPLWEKAARKPWSALIELEKQGLAIAESGRSGPAKLSPLLD